MARTNSIRSRKSTLERNYKNYRDTVLEWSEKPAVRYIAGGIGLAILARLAYNVSEKYPEISRFIRENLDTAEEKLREFRGLAGDRGGIDARH